MNNYDRRFADTIAQVHGWGMCEIHGIPTQQTPDDVVCVVCGDDLVYIDEPTYLMQWLDQYKCKMLRVSMVRMHFPTDTVLVRIIEWMALAPFAMHFIITMPRLSALCRGLELSSLSVDEFMTASIEYFVKANRSEERAFQEHMRWIERQKILYNAWEMDTHLYENHIQWLPREMVEDTIELLHCL